MGFLKRGWQWVQSVWLIFSQRYVSFTSLALVLALAVALLFLYRFNTVLQQRKPLLQVEQKLVKEIATLQAQQAALQITQTYIATDASVIEWAHDQARLIRPNEVLVVPIPVAGAAESQATPLPPPTPVPPNWQLWWQFINHP